MGWVAEYSDLVVQGFPNRFDAKVKGLHLADPNVGWAWTAPEFQMLALSYKPNHFIAVWPHEQKISSLHETITIETSDMRSSVVFSANTALALERTVLIMEDVTLTSSADWVSQMRKATLTTDRSQGSAFAYDIGFQADELKPAHIFKAIVDPDNALPDTFETVRVRTTAHFDAAWDRHAIEGNKPILTKLDIADLSANWGELDFQATGTLALDAQGYPTGKIAIRAKNWKDMINVGVSAGLIPAEIAGPLETGLGLVARLSGNPDTIDAPLQFSKRLMYLGPIPIGPAPQLLIN